MQVRLPDGVRCAIALSYDLEMCGGYQPDRICHGRLMPELQDYTRELCRVAEEYDARLHFFFVTNGFDQAIDLLREIRDRGHVVDQHTYSHLSLRTENLRQLDEELALSNELFETKLGMKSTVLRGPGGYQNGLDGKPENQEIILKNGFRWVSCRLDGTIYDRGRAYTLDAPIRETPYAYPTGLIEIPVQGAVDRQFFENYLNIFPDRYDEWRTNGGGKPVPRGWKAPWTMPGALDEWKRYHTQAIDFAYDHRVLWVPVWHPLSHYLHDGENTVLRHFLEYSRSKPEKIWLCSVRDAAEMIVDDAAAAA